MGLLHHRGCYEGISVAVRLGIKVAPRVVFRVIVRASQKA